MGFWQKMKRGWIGGRDETVQPELLVAILADSRTPESQLHNAAEAWMTALPFARFATFDRSLDRSHIAAPLMEALAHAKLPPGRLLLVGMNDGVRPALDFALDTCCAEVAGILAYDAIVEPAALVVRQGRWPRLRLIGRESEARFDQERFVRAIHDLNAPVASGMTVRSDVVATSPVVPRAPSPAIARDRT